MCALFVIIGSMKKRIMNSGFYMRTFNSFALTRIVADEILCIADDSHKMSQLKLIFYEKEYKTKINK